MTTNTAGSEARELSFQAVHYLKKRVNYNDTGISSGIKMPNALPAGAEILFTAVKIKTAFNAGTTNVLTVGQNSSSYNDIVAAGDVDESVTGNTQVGTGADLDITADTSVFIKYTQTGTAATAGVAEIIIAYAADNDG